jgi:hypothetical protein
MTPIATAAVRGTTFIVEYNEGKSADIAVFEGAVRVKGQNGPEIQVEKDNQSSVMPGKAPEKPHPIEERLLKYYDEKIKQFNKRVEFHRARLDKIREQRIKWMGIQKEQYEDKIEQNKQKQEDRFEKLKLKHRMK